MFPITINITTFEGQQLVVKISIHYNPYRQPYTNAKKWQIKGTPTQMNSYSKAINFYHSMHRLGCDFIIYKVDVL